MKKVLLTGAGGFLGSKIISEWKKDYGLLVAGTGSLRHSEKESIEIIDRNDRSIRGSYVCEYIIAKCV